MGARAKPLRLGAAAGLLALGANACSVLFGFDGFHDDAALALGDAAQSEGSSNEDARGNRDGGNDDSMPPFKGVPCTTDASVGVCLPSFPSDWEGPVILSEGDVDASLPPCPGADLPPVKGVTGLDAGPATCAACSCSPGATSCSDPEVSGEDFFGNCGGNGEKLPPNQCVGLFSTFFNGSKGAITGSSPLGSCAAIGGDASLPPATFSGAGEACNAVAIAAASCPSGETCHAAPPAEFIAGKYCIYTKGDYNCPRSTVYSERHEYGNGTIDEGRGCSPCSCDAVGGTCDTSGLTVSFYKNSNCNGDASITVSVPAACQLLPGMGSGSPSARLSGAPFPGEPATCTPRVATPSPRGTARPGGMWTVCCTR